MAIDTWIAIDGAYRNMATGDTITASTPPPAGPWTPYYTYNLTTNQGWTQTTGNRGLDASYNRAAQTVFGPTGMTITAERASVGATIFSSDAQGRFASIPNYFALEADITLNGYLGSGCFPALWLRPISGQGEIDVWEYFGGIPSGEAWRFKSTIILTSPSPYAVGLVPKMIPIGNIVGGLNGVKHTYRIEKIPNLFSFYIDNVLFNTITQAQVDAAATSSLKWADEFESNQNWYVRLTYQFGPPASGGTNYAGNVPDSWVDPINSQLFCSRMKVWSYTP